MGLYVPSTSIQIEEMDDALRVGLWNALTNHYFGHVLYDEYAYGTQKHYPDDYLKPVCRAFWQHYFKKPLDTLPRDWDSIHAAFRDYFFSASWNEVYDFIEVFPRVFALPEVNRQFCAECNGVMERELSGYRFAGGTIVRVTDPVEIEAIETATHLPSSLRTVANQLEAALRLLSDRKAPDYRNSIKESISAVEGMCALITGQEKADLNAALRLLETKAELHGALKSAFNSLYGFTSDSNGIRHALLDEEHLTFDDAKFMLVACSAFVNYLKSLVANSDTRR
jgi:hypothetical protein